MPFKDRHEAGRRLGARLSRYADRDDVVVLGLPRGGVVVASAVADLLGAPLDVFLVEKLGVPGHEELAMGAIASGGIRVLNQDVVRSYGIPEQTISEVTERERRQLSIKENAYRDGGFRAELEDRVVILVDDGIATGATMKAALAALRAHRPKAVVVAVPTAPPEVCAELEEAADEAICLETPEPFLGVGAWYEDFSQVGNDEVRALLNKVM